MDQPVVGIEGLTKRFGEVTAVDGLSFTVERGQVYGLLGPNGAGKTTALRVLMGLERPTRGTTRLFGTTVTPGCPEFLRVGAMIEEAAFVPHLSGSLARCSLVRSCWCSTNRPMGSTLVRSARYAS